MAVPEGKETNVEHKVTIDSQDRPGGRHWARCEGCGWLGPVRETWDEAQRDQDSHIIEKVDEEFGTVDECHAADVEAAREAFAADHPDHVTTATWTPIDNPPHNALRAAVARAVANGEPEFVEQRCEFTDADECAMARERAVAGKSDQVGVCAVHGEAS